MARIGGRFADRLKPRHLWSGLFLSAVSRGVRSKARFMWIVKLQAAVDAVINGIPAPRPNAIQQSVAIHGFDPVQFVQDSQAGGLTMRTMNFMWRVLGP